MKLLFISTSLNATAIDTIDTIVAIHHFDFVVIEFIEMLNTTAIDSIDSIVAIYAVCIQLFFLFKPILPNKLTTYKLINYFSKALAVIAVKTFLGAKRPKNIKSLFKKP